MRNLMFLAVLWPCLALGGIDRAAISDLGKLQRPADLPGAHSALQKIAQYDVYSQEKNPPKRDNFHLSIPNIETAIKVGIAMTSCEEVAQNMIQAEELFKEIQEQTKKILTLAEQKQSAQLQDALDHLSRLRTDLLAAYPENYDRVDRRIKYTWFFDLSTFSDIWARNTQNEEVTFTPRILNWGDRAFDFSIDSVSQVSGAAEITSNSFSIHFGYDASPIDACLNERRVELSGDLNVSANIGTSVEIPYKRDRKDPISDTFTKTVWKPYSARYGLDLLNEASDK